MSARSRARGEVDAITRAVHSAASPLVQPGDTDIIQLVSAPPLPDLAHPPAELMPESFDPERALAVISTLFAAIEAAPDLATLHNLQAYGGAFQHLLQRLADGRALANVNSARIAIQVSARMSIHSGATIAADVPGAESFVGQVCVL